MARSVRTLSEPDLELALLRKGVGALAAGRQSCADCGRTPLVGERMFRFRRHGSVCALCRPGHAAEPDAVELVRHFELGHTVRRVVPHAA
jgi:recombinational DNA repair protein (RecF pathway)